MAIPTTIESLSTTPASNGPSGSDQRSTADDGIRTAYAFIKMGVIQGADLASATTITPPSTGKVFDVTGTTTITTIASTNSWDGREIVLQFDGALTLTHSSNLALPGSVNITTAAGDVAFMLQRGSGAWRCVNYQRADGTNVGGKGFATTYTPTLTSVANAASLSAGVFTYMRIDNVVHVAGQFTSAASVASAVVMIGISLPIASDLASAGQLAGTGVRQNGSAKEPGTVEADTTNNRAQFECEATNTNAFPVTVTFQYVIV